MKDTNLGKKLEMCKVRSRQRFGLKELMCVPIQRTLKYPLLLRELIKHTSEHHQDRKGLEEALEAVNVRKLVLFV
jgi:guanine nucleotide exchange factor VAV